MMLPDAVPIFVVNDHVRGRELCPSVMGWRTTSLDAEGNHFRTEIASKSDAKTFKGPKAGLVAG